MKNSQGSNLVDYVIPTAIVGMVIGLALYTILNNGLLNKNIAASMKGQQQGEELVLGDTQDLADPGDLGGTPDNPVMQCVNGYCTIDFGDYILNGVPEDLGRVATANRGGETTLEYANMLEALAMQLEETDPVTSNLLNQLAAEARKMAATEIAAGNALEVMNGIETRLKEKTGDVYENVEDELAGINPDSVKQTDCKTLMATAKYMESAGLITQEELGDMATIILDIRADAPNLQPWQKQFINDLQNSSDQVNDICENTLSNLSDEEQAIVVNDNSMLYGVATNSLDCVTNVVSSDNDADHYDAGSNFNDLFSQLYLTPMSQEVKAVSTFICEQVQLIGNSVESTTTPIDGYGNTVVNLEIPEDSGVETLVASQMLEELSD